MLGCWAQLEGRAATPALLPDMYTPSPGHTVPDRPLLGLELRTRKDPATTTTTANDAVRRSRRPRTGVILRLGRAERYARDRSPVPTPPYPMPPTYGHTPPTRRADA